MERENLVHKVESEWTRDGDYKITLRGLTEADRRNLEQMLLGLAWGRVNEKKRIETAPALKGVPGPIDDNEMLPFWRRATAEELAKAAKTTLKKHNDALPDGCSGIVIESLCGYDFTPDFYREVAKKLESYGFECIRSRRDQDGCFWELWYLCGLFAAKGDLKKAIRYTKDRNDQMSEAISFLCRNTSFGSLSVTTQRAVMPVDD